MFALGFNEIIIILLVGGFWVVVLLAVVALIAARRGSLVPISRPATASPTSPATGPSRLPLFIALWLLCLLCFVVTVPGAFFIGFGHTPFWMLIIVGLLLFGLLTAALVTAFVFASIRPSMAHSQVAAQEPAHPYEVPSHVEVIARLTQRFCPQCRSSLAADAPEGLCPACLMAGGLASVTEPVVNGMAVTTPPSGSQPPASGEWSDLQRHFPDYDILELLGRGGMGAVYKARQKKLDRLVAIKVIPPDAAKDPAFTERFAREARAMARLNHPNIVTVYDYSDGGDLCWLMMEYVDGINLRHTLRAGRLAPKEGLAIVPQICDALQYAHDQGVVHRDIKPENVLLDRSGRVKIADFGLAKLLGKGPDDFTLTRTQQVMGTPRYMAPEQIERPSTVDHRADIYSLGVVLYEMLTGELPLGRFEPPSHKVQVDVRIDEVVLRALEKSPDRRYQRASEVKTELASAVSWPTLAMPAVPATIAPAPPVWRTPAPATKYDSAAQPGGVPLAQVLLVAFGMLLGVLMMGGGLATLVYAAIVVVQGDWVVDQIWAVIGAGFGCLVGGFGLVAGSYNTYRQMAGAEDLMRSPRTTWFDWVMRGYLALGLLLLAAGMFFIDPVYTEGIGNALLLIGGIATLQGAVFVLWRLTVITGYSRPRAAAQVTAAAEPGYLRAMVWPAAAIAGVFAVLLADVYFAIPAATPYADVTPKMKAYREWHEGLLLTGLIAVPMCLLVLGAWRTWGPRVFADDGRPRVAYPFAPRAWLWIVAGLAALSLFLPWFSLHFQPQAGVLLNPKDVFPSTQNNPTAFTPIDDVLKQAAAMPSGWRFAHRGIQQGSMLATAGILIFAAIFSALVFVPHHPARIAFLLVAASISLLQSTMLLHQAADQRERIVVDDTTEAGIHALAARTYGSQPPTVLPWRQAVRQAFVARPSLGAFALLAACGLAILIGVTELSWGGVVMPEAAADAKPIAKFAVAPAAIDPARQAVLSRVAGPGIGLVVAGILGLLPLLLAVLAIPTWTLVPQGGYREPLEYLDGGLAATLAPAIPVPLTVGIGSMPAGTCAILPPLLGYQVDAPPDRGPLPTVALVSPFVLLFLLNLAWSITLMIGGWRMRQARSYGLALVAAIMALLPCTFGWIIGLPIGIWALTVLLDPTVKSSFES